jgi:hypothetical protein
VRQIQSPDAGLARSDRDGAAVGTLTVNAKVPPGSRVLGEAGRGGVR